MDIDQINIELATKTPIEIVQWALNYGQTPIITQILDPMSQLFYTLLHGFAPQ